MGPDIILFPFLFPQESAERGAGDNSTKKKKKKKENWDTEEISQPSPPLYVAA